VTGEGSGTSGRSPGVAARTGQGLAAAAAYALWIAAVVATFPSLRASGFLLAGGLVASVAVSVIGVGRRWPLGRLAGLAWVTLLATTASSYVLFPAVGAGGTRVGGLEPSQVGHLLMLGSIALPLVVVWRWLGKAALILAIPALWCALPFFAGAVLNLPLDEAPVAEGVWSVLPVWLHPAGLTALLYFPWAMAVLAAGAVRHARKESTWGPSMIALALWLLAMLPAWVLAMHLLRLNHVRTPLDLVLPSEPAVGRTTTLLSDGTAITISTKGYDELTDEQRAARPRLRFLARGVRSADLSQRSRLWLAALDERGRSVQDLEAADLELSVEGRPIRRFDLQRETSTLPPTLAPPFIWIANSGEQTVSKLSTRTGEELDRFRVGADPSRTAVDLDGNVFVASRGSHELTKIEAAGCAGQSCLAFTVPTCRGPRGVAVDAHNRVWVGGTWTDDRVENPGCLQVHDADDGAVLESFDGIPGRIYGLALDARGRVWGVLSPGDKLVRIERVGREMTYYDPPGGASPYGIAVDQRGRVWVGDNAGGGVLRFDPDAEAWVRFGEGEGQARGVAADAAGNVWVADSGRDLLMKFDGESGELLGRYDSGGSDPVGVAVDSEQMIWAVNQGSSLAVRFEPERGGTVGAYAVGAAPYTYSDMTGYALHTFVARRGAYRLDFFASPFELTIVEPEDGAVWPTTAVEDRAIAVHIDQYDPDDPVGQVAYAVDGLPIGTVEDAPFDLSWASEEIGEGPHSIRAEAVSTSGYTDADEVTVHAVRSYGTVAIELRQDGQPVDHVPRTIEFVLDSSGSMWGWAGDGLKIDLAKQVLLDIASRLPGDAIVGLRAYGHRDKTCQDTELLVVPAPLDVALLRDRVGALRPHGKTPIAASLLRAAQDLKDKGAGGHLGERIVVLVTDGIETCGGDPCETAAGLNDLLVRASVVGFGLGAEVDRSSLQCMADATGGLYAEADDAESLADGLARAVEVFYQLVDDDGRVVYLGTLSQPQVLVPTGRYHVRFGATAAETVLQSKPFVVPPDQTVSVVLGLQQDGPPTLHVHP